MRTRERETEREVDREREREREEYGPMSRLGRGPCCSLLGYFAHKKALPPRTRN